MDRLTHRLTQIAGRISDVGGYVAAACIAIILALVCVEVLLRNVFRSSTLIADEMSGYLNAAVLFLGLAYTLKEGGFIRVEVVYNKLRGWFGMTVKWVITLFSLLYTAVLVVYIWQHVTYSYAFNVRSPDVTSTPLFIPQLVMWLGAVILGIQLLSYVLNRVRNVP
jgi:TRAP-type mannitol/chloroaromatic compound transport system permease small subunit